MKKILLIFSLLILSNINFAEEKAVLENENITETTEKIVEEKPRKVILDVKSVYDSLNIKDKIDYTIFQKAYLGYVQISNKNPGILIIIDYSKPSNEERFYVLDLDKKKLVYSTRVAHSKNSGLEIPLQFSDDPNSYQSSLGFFVTLGEYNGAYGYSLRLKGLEENINANAEDRAIVIHGGDIVEDEYIKKFGFAGRSLGCPVLPYSKTREIIDFIKHGRVLFIYGNDEEYIDNSLYLSKLAPIFEGKPQNIVELEKPQEVQRVVTTTVTTTTEPVSRETLIAEANITKILEIIKQESEYTNNTGISKIVNPIKYTDLLKKVIQDKNSTVQEPIKEEIEVKVENVVEETTNNNQEKVSENVSDNTENKNEKQDETRKYPEEVTKTSLGIGVKLK